MASSSGGIRNTFFAVRLALPAFLLLAVSTVCHAKNNCPWMTEATASGLLDSDAVGEFNAGSQGQPAVCTFVPKDVGVARTLTITVKVTPDFDAEFRSTTGACGPDATSMQAIGNVATVCTQDNRKGGLGELAVGRVRDQVFTIALGASLKGDLIFTRSELKSRIYTAAEQVAGNLF